VLLVVQHRKQHVKVVQHILEEPGPLQREVEIAAGPLFRIFFLERDRRTGDHITERFKEGP
jgi:hypothetical protein